MTGAVDRLDFRIQKWINKQGWKSLRDIQEASVEPVLARATDVVISASTASGKTEAFFLPALSAVTAQGEDGFGIIYLSPLKALINDQYRRLEGLCELLDLPLTPWHGDVAQSKKQKVKKSPAGVLLITPESLEAMLMLNAGWARNAFSRLQYVVIDEFHAFIGSERGMQLVSLLNRLEALVGRTRDPIPRVALSATLGNLDGTPKMLRPGGNFPCTLIHDASSGSVLKLEVKGYVHPLNEQSIPAETQVCNELFTRCRGGNHLIFANSRQRTEMIAANLREQCEDRGVPNEFFPHHGSLSKEQRESLEARLQAGKYPTSAVCTMTLELGIDIGDVDSVIQVTAPHSVSSLRQRMGRSGRRGGAAVLRMLITENEISQRSSVGDLLRMELLQSLAMIRLLVKEKWYEPPDTGQFHYSTLFHQILAVIAQWGGLRADSIFHLLCSGGPFKQVSTESFLKLLRHMGSEDIIAQLSDGSLTLGSKGEQLVNHYTFYAVFQTPEEFRIVHNGKTLGSVPAESMFFVGQHIIFGGRRWRVKDVDEDKKVVFVDADKGGLPPKFGGSGLGIADEIRQEMFRIYCQGDYRIEAPNGLVDFLDEKARALFSEGLRQFKGLGLEQNHFVQNHDHVYLLPWMGDKVTNTLTMMLRYLEYDASSFGGVIEIQRAQVSNVRNALANAREKLHLTEEALAQEVENTVTEKFDWFLPIDLRQEGYGRKAFDVSGAFSWIERTVA